VRACVRVRVTQQVSLKWSEDRVKPWDQVSLTVTVRDPSSRVLLLVTSGTAEAQLPLVDWLSNRETVLRVALLREHVVTTHARRPLLG